jgi:hypothetical protein
VILRQYCAFSYFISRTCINYQAVSARPINGASIRVGEVPRVGAVISVSSCILICC